MEGPAASAGAGTGATSAGVVVSVTEVAAFGAGVSASGALPFTFGSELSNSSFLAEFMVCVPSDLYSVTLSSGPTWLALVDEPVWTTVLMA